MKSGQYVRCPIVFEEKDVAFPRNFIMAQIISINELSETVRVKLYDMWKTRVLYKHVFKTDTFPISRVTRCIAYKDAKVITPDGQGRIVSQRSDDGSTLLESEDYHFYYVKLYDGRINQYSEAQLEIGYIACDYSPLQQMVHYEFQHPSWYRQRLRVSRNMHLVDNAVYGFDIMSGCRAFMLEHQIATVVRVFESRPIRYMLADEVGLGKTIEACSILKILASENANFRALFVVPAALAHQWQNELKYKFGLSSAIKASMATYVNNFILPLEELSPSHPAMHESWDMLIVDETHRLLNSPSLYSQVLELSKRIKQVLLLSATPIQDRKEEYLNLLRLLLPAQYDKMSLDEFTKLLNHQKKIQLKVNGLIRHMKSYDDYQEDIFEQLNELADMLQDKYLHRLLGKFDFQSEDHGQSIAALGISFVTENYRIQRKVIRNRREFISAPMGTRKLIALDYTPGTNDDNYGEENVYNCLLQYMEEINEGSTTYIKNTVQPLLMAMFSSPWALREEIKRQSIHNSLLTESVELWVAQANDEIAQSNILLDESPMLIQGRLLRAVDYLEQEVFTCSSSGKVVVFTNYIETLHAFKKILDLRNHHAATFCKGMSPEELEGNVYAFQNKSTCNIIICDETGGEGRNFQNADWIIHLDLPWTANAIEQRIGRLDRLGRDAEHMDVNSVVLYSCGTIEEQLFDIWQKGMNLFGQSLSGLEIITGELNESIVTAMRDDISGGLRRALDDIIEMTEDAKDAVEDEQLYDSGTIIYKPMALAVNHMLKLYQNEEGNLFQESMMEWASQTGLFPTNICTETLTEFSERDFKIKAAMQALFIPPDWKKYQTASSFRRFNSILGTFDRSTAIKREDLLFFAPGDKLFDSLVGNAVHNGRGRCTVFSGKASFNYSGFAFTYNVGPNINYLLSKNVPLALVSQFGVYLPLEQIRIFIPSNEDSAQVPDSELNEYLNDRNSLLNVTHLGTRTGSKGNSKIERFIDAHPPEVWADYVIGIEKKAKSIAYKRCIEASDLDTVKREIVRLVNGYEAECIYLGKDSSIIEPVKDQYRAVFKSLNHPMITLDSVCHIRVEV